MAAKKPTAPKPTPVPRIRRESPVDPGHMMPTEPPQLHNMQPEQQAYTRQQVGGAIERMTGGKYDSKQAVASRKSAVIGAIDYERGEARRTGVAKLPEGAPWYSEHQQAGRETAAATGARIGHAIDTSAGLSPRNSPENERVAARSAMFIGMNPQHEVSISQQLAPHVGNYRKASKEDVAAGHAEKMGVLVQESSSLPGRRALGSMSAKEVASLGHGASKVELAGGKHDIGPELGNVTRLAAGRPAGERGVRLARGESFDEVLGDAPKVRSYAVAAHTATAREDTHNQMQLWTLTHGAGYRTTPEGDVRAPSNREIQAYHHPRQGQQSWSQHEMYPGLQKSVLSEHKHDPTAEDYVMNAMTVEHAHAEGKPSWPARAAMDVVGHAVTKGGAGNPMPDVTKAEMLHAENTAATHETGDALNLTPVATQALSWIHHRRTVLGEDTEWNARQKRIGKEQVVHERMQAQAAAPPQPSKMGGLFRDRRRGAITDTPDVNPTAVSTPETIQAAVSGKAKFRTTQSHGPAEKTKYGPGVQPKKVKTKQLGMF